MVEINIRDIEKIIERLRLNNRVVEYGFKNKKL